MSDHVLRFEIADVTRFDEVDMAVAKAIKDWTGWNQADSLKHAQGERTRVELTAVGDKPKGRGFRHYNASVEVTV